MNIRDLEYLVALSEFKHFGKAAHHCCVSQPTLSGQIKKLEEELQVSLIERKARIFIFTDVGEQILIKAKETLAIQSEIYNMASFSQNPFQGEIRIGLIPTVGPYLLPLVLQELSLKFPDISFKLFEKKTPEIIEGLKQGNLDCGILALPLGESKLEEQPLYTEAFVALAPPNEGSNNKPKVDSKVFLKGKDILLLEEGHCFGDQALELCSRSTDSNLLHSNNLKGTSLELFKHMVALGDHYTLAPKLAVHLWSSSQSNLNVIEFKTPVPSRSVGLLFRKGSPRKELFDELGNLITQCIPNELKQPPEEAEVIPF